MVKKSKITIIYGCKKSGDKKLDVVRMRKRTRKTFNFIENVE